MNKRPPPKDIDHQYVLQLYEKHHNGREVARQLNVHPDKVHRVLNYYGIHPGKGANNPRRFDRQRIVDLYLKYGSSGIVAAHIGCSPSCVLRTLCRFGIKPPPLGHQNVKYHIPMDVIAQRYKAGESTCELAKEYGVDSERIRRRLETMKVPRRSLKESRAHGEKNGSYINGNSLKRSVDKDMHYYRRQAYEVAAICLGQPLAQGKIIHHLDSDWHNNQPGNLVIFGNQNSHARYHMKLLRLQRKGLAVDTTRLALESDALKLPQPPSPIQF